MTIGNYLEIGLAIVALLVIPAAIIKAWWPALRAGLRRFGRWIWAGLCSLFVVAEEGADTYISPGDTWRALVGLFWRPAVMSSDEADQAAGQVGDAAGDHPAGELVQPIAMSSNAVNNQVIGDAGDTIPAEYRAAIRYQAQAEAIAALLDAGLLTNQAKAIETVYRVSRTAKSRPDTPYQKALQLVERLRARQRPELVGDMIERVKREVAAETK